MLVMSGWTDAAIGGWNASERKIGAIRRIPLQGLTLVNQDPANDPATAESAAGRAILYVPSVLDISKPVEVLFHLHGANIGYRDRAGKNVPGAGTVRDVDVDKIADQLASSERRALGVMVQGSLAPTFGCAGTTGFDVNSVLAEVLDTAVRDGVWTTAPQISRVTLCAQGAGGDTIGALLDQPGQPRLPRTMGGLFLFAAIDAPEELATLTRYLTDRLTYDLLNLANLAQSVSDQLAYLRSSTRLRAFYNPRDETSATNHVTLQQSLVAWFTRNADDIGGKESATYEALTENYQIIAVPGATNDGIVGTSLRSALSAPG